MKPTLAYALSLALVALTLGACASDRVSEGADADAPSVLLVMTNTGAMDNGEPTGVWLDEASHPYTVFREAGFRVVLASPDGGASPIDARSLGDPDAEGLDFLRRYAEDGAVTGTVDLARVDPAEYDAVFFAGGHGTMWDFPLDRDVKTAAETIYAGGGVVAAVCHGPAALVQIETPEGAPIVAGRRVTGFTNAEEDAVELTDAMPFLLETRMREQGGVFIGAPNFEANVLTDGRLVTGQNPASARGTAEAVVRLVGGR